MKRTLIFITAIILLISCNNSSISESYQSEPSDAEKYHLALLDAMIADSSEICHNLTVIDKKNRALIFKNNDSSYILTTSLISSKYLSSYKINDTLTIRWDSWITASPELKEKINQEKIYSNKLNLRLNQLLGLPPTRNSTDTAYIVEMWVKMSDLFRPAYNREINVTSSGIVLPDSASYSDYKLWFNNNILSSYFTGKSDYEKFPWTRLGYTYDWGNPKSEIGLSEFVINKNSSKVIVNSVTKIYDYFTTIKD